MPQNIERFLDVQQRSALTSWQPNPNSLLTCLNYSTFPRDLRKNKKREGNASQVVFETTMQTSLFLRLEVKWGM